LDLECDILVSSPFAFTRNLYRYIPVLAIEDPRWAQPGWGSRNPLVWLLWIIARPFTLLFMVRTGPVLYCPPPLYLLSLLSFISTLPFSFDASRDVLVRAVLLFFSGGLNLFLAPAPPLSEFAFLLQLFRCCTNCGVQCLPMLTILAFWMILVYSLFGSFSTAG
jgi:hypothetical protein